MPKEPLWRQVVNILVEKWDPLAHPRDKNGKFIPKGMVAGLKIDPANSTKSTKALVHAMHKAGHPITKEHLLALLGQAGITEKNLITAAGGQYAFVGKTHAWAAELVKSGAEPTADDLKYYTKLVGKDTLQEIVDFYKAGGPKQAEPEKTTQQTFDSILDKVSPGGGVTAAKQTILQLIQAGVPLDKSMALNLAGIHGDGTKNSATAINHAFMMLNKLNESVKADLAAGIDIDPAKYAKLGGKAYAQAIVDHYKANGAPVSPQEAPKEPVAPATPPKAQKAPKKAKEPKAEEPKAEATGSDPLNPNDFETTGYGGSTKGLDVQQIHIDSAAFKLQQLDKKKGGVLTQEDFDALAHGGGPTLTPALYAALYAEMKATGKWDADLATFKAKHLAAAGQAKKGWADGLDSNDLKDIVNKAPITWSHIKWTKQDIQNSFDLTEKGLQAIADNNEVTIGLVKALFNAYKNQPDEFHDLNIHSFTDLLGKAQSAGKNDKEAAADELINALFPGNTPAASATNTLTERHFIGKDDMGESLPITQDGIDFLQMKIIDLLHDKEFPTDDDIAGLSAYASPALHKALYAEHKATNGAPIDLEKFKAKVLNGDLNQATMPPGPPPKTAKDVKQPNPLNQHAPGVPLIPPDPASALTYAGGAHSLGGFGDKHFFTDKAGNKFIFKPATNKGTGAVEPFKAKAEEMGQELASKIYGDDFSIPTKAVEMEVNGKKVIGTLQPIVENHGNLATGGHNWKTMTTDKQEQLLSHHVLDWAISNYDNHTGQFIVAKHTGNIIGLDKEQAFRWMLQDPTGSAKMSHSYHPNKQIAGAAEEPVTNSMFRAYAKGELHVDLNKAILPALKKLEAITDAEYVKTITGFSVMASKKYPGTMPSDIMTKALKRKKETREQYREFFTKLETERAKALGKTLPAGYKFKFADEMGEIPDNVAAETGVAKPAAKAKKATTPKAKKGTSQAAQWGLKADPLTEDMSAIKPTAGQKPYFGTVLAKDSDIVEHHNVLMRKVTDAGKPGYEIEFKATKPYHDEIMAAMQKAGGVSEVYHKFQEGSYDADGVFNRKNSWNGMSGGTAKMIKDGNVEVQFHYKDGTHAMNGTVRVKWNGPHADGKKATQEIQATLKKLGLEGVTKDPTPEDEVHLRARTALRQMNPAKAEELRKEKDPKKVYAELAKLGVTTDDLKGMTREEVFPGFHTYVDKKAAKAYKDAGAAYLYHGITGGAGGFTGKIDRLLAMLDGGGLQATKYRYNNGKFAGGASSSSDMGTGGADSVFLGLVTDHAKKNSSDFNGWGPPYLLFDQEIMGRRDWYGRTSDTFGDTSPAHVKSEKGAVDFVKHLNGAGYYSSNELMFRGGVPTTAMRGIAVKNTTQRGQVINALKAKGYHTINGVPVEKFVQVATGPGSVELHPPK